jgi:hypothetical protein
MTREEEITHAYYLHKGQTYSCAGRKQFDVYEKAFRSAAGYNKHRLCLEAFEAADPYKCPFCGKWHIGKTDNSLSMRIEMYLAKEGLLDSNGEFTKKAEDFLAKSKY